MSTTKKTNWLHVAISWGASIVILGAMFKINHWGGQLGTYMIGLGLTVPAFAYASLMDLSSASPVAAVYFPTSISSVPKARTVRILVMA